MALERFWLAKAMMMMMMIIIIIIIIMLLNGSCAELFGEEVA